MGFFELRRTLETTVGPDGGQAVRLELYQSLTDARRFRARVFAFESYRLRLTEPQEDGEPTERCDDVLAAERSFNWLDVCWRDEFEAANVEEALALLIQDFQRASRGEFRRARPHKEP
jgi:hypothetical protein